MNTTLAMMTEADLSGTPLAPLRRFPIRTWRWLLAVFFLLPSAAMGVGSYVADPSLRSGLWFGVLATMCGLPWVVWRVTHRPPAEVRRVIGLRRTRLVHGLWTGLVAAGVIGGIYVAFFRGRTDAGVAAAGAGGRTSFAAFWVWAGMLSLGHSLFEEFYWRGFLLAELALWVKRPRRLILLMAGLFSLHHAVVLVPILDPGRLAICLLLTMVGSAAWTLMRLRGVSLWDCWLSHAFADLAIAWVAWDLISAAR